MISRKLVLLVLAIVLVFGSLPLAAQDDQINMSMWVRAISFETQTLVDTWNANNDSQIELTVIPAGTEFVTKMGAAIAAGEQPDIASIDLIFTPVFSSAGQLTDLTEYVRALPFADDLTPAHMGLGMFEGRHYAVPTAVDGSFMVYNKDLFEQAGLDPEAPPSNWDELLDAARAVNALGDDIYGYWFSGACAGCLGFIHMPFVWANGGRFFSDDNSEATISNEPAMRDMLELFRTMWEEGLIPEGAAVDNGANFVGAFAGGNIGMAGVGNFALPTYVNDHPDLNFGVFHFPGKEGGSASFAGGDVIAIPAGTEHVEEAWRFIEWTLSEEAQLEIYAANGQIPVRLSLVDNEYFEGDARQHTAASALAVGHAPWSTVFPRLFNDPNGPWLEMFQVGVLDGDIDGALEVAQERFTQIMSEG
ncbi:MAG: sugar ABC transporter substrate-binding protein [Chloroflexi bacterium]|nr:sugar ABC transporter substrate-binding protein [Chloroflexota bacterium]